MDSEQTNSAGEEGQDDSQDLLDSDILIYAGPITRDGFEQVVRQNPRGGRKKILLVLATLGRDADAAYRIARFLRQSYECFTVFVPGLCKSAGTLLCIGAHEIVISQTGELGPLDVQVHNPEELADYTSGLDIPQAFDFVRGKALHTLRAILVDVAAGGGLATKRSAEIATNVTVGLFSPIFAQIAPARLGGNARALLIARDYAARLDGNLVGDAALEQLVAGYPSHSFSIDRDEAAKLFKSVRYPNRRASELSARFDAVLNTPTIVRARSCFCVYFESDEDVANEADEATPT